MSFYASYPFVGGGGGVPVYTTFAAFPAANSVPAGTLAVAADTGILYESNGTTWQVIGGPGVVTSIGSFGSTSTANAAIITANALILEPADGTHPGAVSTTTQTFGGNKTFTGTIGASNLSGTNTGDVTLTAVGASPQANGASLSGQVLTLQPANTSFSGVLLAADWNTFNNKQNAGNYITQLIPPGDVTASGPGSAIATIQKIQGTLVSGTTGTTNVVFSSAPTLTNPVVGTQAQSDASTKAASTAYVTTAISNAVSGVNPAVAVQAATTAASDTSTYVYNNGVSGIGATLTAGSNNIALIVDGFTFSALGQRLLVKNDTQSPSGAFNGIYYVTQLQAALLPVILTRALDYDQPSDINNTGAIPVINGTVNGTTSWVETSQVTTIGTDPLAFTKFTRNPADYLLKTNNLSDVSSTNISFNNISPLTTKGDLVAFSTVNARLPVGSDAQILTADSTQTTGLKWVASVGVPTGSVTQFAGTSAPAGWIMCDGSAISRTTFSALFAIIASNYGNGDGSTTFNLPDMRGKFARGTDNMGTAAGAAGNDPDTSSRTAQTTGGNTGDNVGSIQSNQYSSHSHIVAAIGTGTSNIHTTAFASGTDTSLGTGNNTAVNLTTGLAGGNETRPINVYFNYMIKT